jgi:hypothetical protein
MGRKRSPRRLLLDTTAVIYHLHGHTLQQAAVREADAGAEVLVPVFVRRTRYSPLTGQRNQVGIQDLKESARALRVIDVEIQAADCRARVERPAEAKDR